MRRINAARAVRRTLDARRPSGTVAEKALPTNALLRRVWSHAAKSQPTAAAQGVPLPAFVQAAEKLVAESTDFAPLKPWGDASAHSVASTTINRIYHAKRGVFVDERTNTVFLEPNSNVKHSRAVLRAIARLPDAGSPRRTPRSWLPKLSDDEFAAAIERVFNMWVSTDGENVVPVRPGSTPAARAVFQIIMAAPDDGIGLKQTASSVATRTGKTMGDDELRAILAELWPYHAMTTAGAGRSTSGLASAAGGTDAPAVEFMSRAVCFVDWRSVMRRVVDSIPPEGVTLLQLKRILNSEGHWSMTNPPDFDGIVTAEWLDANFGHLVHTRIARTDGATVIVTARVGVAVEGAAGCVNRALLANPDGSAPTLPFNGGWRDANAPLAALEQILPARATVGCESWLQYAREHPAFDYSVMVELRPRPDRSRAVTFVDASCGSSKEVAQWLHKAGVFTDHLVEWKRIALRNASQAPHSDGDIVSPSWLEPEFVLAAQVTNLDAHLAGPGADVSQLVVVCSDEAAATYSRVVAEAAPSALERLMIVTPTTSHTVTREEPQHQ
jgi:hypothetical protein